jgi:cytochrome c oxidase subunit IV
MSDHSHAEKVHIVSYGQYFLIWLGLLALTIITVALGGIDLGDWVVITALTIASIKTMLVLNIFMHLKFEERTFRIFVLVAGITMAIFIILIFSDYAFY